MCQNWDGQLSSLVPQNPGPAFSSVWCRQKAAPAPHMLPPTAVCVCSLCVCPALAANQEQVPIICLVMLGQTQLLMRRCCSLRKHDLLYSSAVDISLSEYLADKATLHLQRPLSSQAKPDFSRRLALLLQGLVDYAVNHMQETLNENPNS